MSENRSIGILHISDIHIGSIPGQNFKHAFHGKSIANLISQSFSDTDNIKQRDYVKLYLVISGDLVCDGSNSNDYDTAFGEIDKLCNEIKIDKECVIIVPGNHDINRKDKSNTFSKFKACYDKFFKDTPGKHFTINKKNYQFEKEKWLHIDNSNNVIFIPLYSVYTDDDKIPKFIKKIFKRNKFNHRVNWVFDRGLIDENQLNQVKNELKSIDDSEKYIKIAIFHHNPVALARSHFTVDEHDFPSICHLSNGPEILARLQDMGVSLVLHGHTHQNSINIFCDDYNKDGLIIFGASHFCDSKNLNLPWIPTVNKYGFNFIDINNSLATPKIKLYSFISTEQAHRLTFTIENTNPPDLNIPRLIEKEIEKTLGKKYFLNFDEGIVRLSELIKYKNNNKIYLLNYSDGTDWNDHFTEIWEDVANKEQIIGSLQEICRNDNGRLQDSIRKSIDKTTNTYTRELIKELRKDTIQHIINRLSGKTPAEDPFTSHIINRLADKTPRDTNYFLEIFRCVIDESFKLNKGVYFKANQNNMVKFKWLCDSILSARNLNNFNLAWLPFSIKSYTGNSLVAALNEKSDVTVLIGYHENHDKYYQNKKSVLRIPDNEDMDATDESGLLYISLRALIRKIIVPLSERLLVDFPLYVNGTLYINNLEFLANIYKCETVWNEMYKNRFQCIFNEKSDEENMMNESKIDEMYKWVAKVDDKIAIPWSEVDYNYLKTEINVRNS